MDLIPEGSLQLRIVCDSPGLYYSEGQSLLPSNEQQVRGNILKLCQGQFRLDIKKNFLHRKGCQHWNRLAREDAEALFQEVLKHLNVALGAVV